MVAWWLRPRTPDPEVGGSSPTGSPCCVLNTYLLPKSTGNTQEVVAPSQHDLKNFYRDVKHQTNQPNSFFNKTTKGSNQNALYF